MVWVMKKGKKKCIFLFYHHQEGFFLFFCSVPFWHFLKQWHEVSWRLFNCLESSHIYWALAWGFSFTLHSNSSQTFSAGFRSGECRGQIIKCHTLLLHRGQIALMEPVSGYWLFFPLKNKSFSHWEQSRCHCGALRNSWCWDVSPVCTLERLMCALIWSTAKTILEKTF